jgi:hypothetical protein
VELTSHFQERVWALVKGWAAETVAAETGCQLLSSLTNTNTQLTSN